MCLFLPSPASGIRWEGCMTSKPSRLVLALVVVASVLLLTAQVTARPALASDPICGSNVARFDGFGYDPTASGHSAYGTSAYLETRSFGLCSDVKNSGNFVTAWTMIEGGGGNGWVQSGYIGWYGHYPVHVSQYAASSSATPVSKYLNTQLFEPDVYKYTQRYVTSGCPSSSHCTRSEVSGSVLLVTNFDPRTTWPPQWNADYFGETRYAANDMPGGPGRSAKYTGMAYQYRYGTASDWTTQPCGMWTRNDNTAAWAQGTAACDQRSIWSLSPG
jgi:hypothetical protein